MLTLVRTTKIMKKYKTVLVNLSIHVEVPENNLEAEEFNEFDKFENSLSDSIESIDSPYKISWESSRSLVLEPEFMNCGKCEECGCWVSDVESPKSISGLNIGAIHNGKLLCDECLPKDHKLAF